jgi:ribonuclease-3
VAGFLDPLVTTALTHSSWANLKGGADNERLEFLGDAVLQIVVSELLFTRFPAEPEGELSRMRRELVKNEHLAPIARAIGLGAALLLAPDLEREGGRELDHILAGTLEAVFGAIYLIDGAAEAQAVITGLMEPSIERVRHHRDPRVVLQEWCLARLGAPPQYVEEAQRGPAHRLEFRMSVAIAGERVGEGEGNSKDKARHAAALQALATLEADGRLHAPLPAPAAPAPRPRKEPERGPVATLDMWVQRLAIGPLRYEDLGMVGPPDQPTHRLAAVAAGSVLGQGEGPNKARAREAAAESAVAALMESGRPAAWEKQRAKKK